MAAIEAKSSSPEPVTSSRHPSKGERMPCSGQHDADAARSGQSGASEKADCGGPSGASSASEELSSDAGAGASASTMSTSVSTANRRQRCGGTSVPGVSASKDELDTVADVQGSCEKLERTSKAAKKPKTAAAAADSRSKLTSAELLLLLSPSIASSANLASAAGPYSCKICSAKFPSLHALGYHQAHHRRTAAAGRRSGGADASDLPSAPAGKGKRRGAEAGAREGVGESQSRGAGETKSAAVELLRSLPTSPAGKGRKRAAPASGDGAKGKGGDKRNRVAERSPRAPGHKSKPSHASTPGIPLTAVPAQPSEPAPAVFSAAHAGDAARPSATGTGHAPAPSSAAAWKDPLVSTFAPPVPGVTSTRAAASSMTLVRPTPSRASPPGHQQPSHLSNITERVLGQHTAMPATKDGGALPAMAAGLWVLARAAERPALRPPAPLVLPREGAGADLGPDSKASVVTQAQSELTADHDAPSHSISNGHVSPTTPSNGLPLSPFSQYAGKGKPLAHARPQAASHPAFAPAHAMLGPGSMSALRAIPEAAPPVQRQALAPSPSTSQEQPSAMAPIRQTELLAQLNQLLLQQQQHQKQRQQQLQQFQQEHPHLQRQQLHAQQAGNPHAPLPSMQASTAHASLASLPSGNPLTSHASLQPQSLPQAQSQVLSQPHLQPVSHGSSAELRQLSSQQHMLVMQLKHQLQQLQQHPQAAPPQASSRASLPLQPSGPSGAAGTCCALQCSTKAMPCIASPATLSCVLSLLSAVTAAPGGAPRLSPPAPAGVPRQSPAAPKAGIDLDLHL